MKKFVRENMGGVGAPMATLTNTPGMGSAVPPSTGGIGSGDSWGNKLNKKPYTQANKPKLKIAKKKKKAVKKIEEENINPFDKIGMSMAKKMGVKPPFKKKKQKGNQNAVVQQKFEHAICTLEEFINEKKFERGKDAKDAMEIGIAPELKQFKDFFNMKYRHMSHDLTDKEIAKFLSQAWIANRSISSKADLFADYLLSQGIGDVQL